MGVAGSDMHAAEQPAADSLLNAFKTIDDSGMAKHSNVLAYWLSIRGDREFPPLHDLDPLQISDAGPCSALLELIGGGEDAEVRHLGETLKTDVAVERIADAPRPSILACIANKLSIVAISRNVLAFEDEFPAGDAITRCWVTLLPLSSAGPGWTMSTRSPPSRPCQSKPRLLSKRSPKRCRSLRPAMFRKPARIPPMDTQEEAEEAEQAMEDVEHNAAMATDADEPATAAPEAAAAAETSPGFSEMFHNPATADGFYGAATVKVAPSRSPAPAAALPAVLPPGSRRPSPGGAPAEPLAAKLAAVRAKADEARMAKLKSNAALYEGLSAAYDFALDAEDSSEEYLKLVEAQGLKIQLRSPMLPVMKLAFAGMCDDSTVARLEAVLAWALEQELPRGSLAARIEAEGGIARILSGEASAS